MSESTRPDLWAASVRATGITEAQWLDYFANHHDTPHDELAKLAYQRLYDHAATHPALADKNLHWWAQGIAVAFEYHIGRRARAQRCDGTFGASASKTLNGTMDQVADAWAAFADNLYEVAGVALADEPRRTATDKWRYWRTELDNGVPVSVNITNKAPAKDGTPKVALAVEMRGLESTEQSDAFKAARKQILSDFAAYYKKHS